MNVKKCHVNIVKLLSPAYFRKIHKLFLLLSNEDEMVNVINVPNTAITTNGMKKSQSTLPIAEGNTKEANKIMRAYVKDPTTVVQRKLCHEVYKKAVESAPKQVKLAPKPVIDRTYRTLLSLCVLREEHKKNLLKRGLTEKQIAHYGFKSVPWKNESDTIVKQLLEKGCTLKGVPGFYYEHGKWKMAVSYKNRGFFVPMLNIKGQCLGMQIRRDTGDPKYLWFSSSGYEQGCNRTSIPTFSNHWNIGRSICITEGGLSATRS